MKGKLAIVFSTLLMTALFSLLFNYLFGYGYFSLVYGFLVSTCVIMSHEMVHKLVGLFVCGAKAKFKLTDFAIVMSFLSIVVISFLIVIKETSGFVTYFVPLVASPGAVMIDKIRHESCLDNVAISAPFANFVIGSAILLYLKFVHGLPINLSNLHDPIIIALSLISYFSLALAMVNSLPIKIGSLKFDGYLAITRDRDDIVKLLMFVVSIVVPALILYVWQPIMMMR